MRALIKQLAVLAFIAITSPAIAQVAAQPTLPIKPLSAGIHLIQAEVAMTEAQRANGLMYREKMPANAGMLFIFDRPEAVCMWMKNTLLPLSVAFIDEQGKIVNIEDMQAQTLTTHCAQQPVRYALEANLGWFKQRGIGKGQKIGGLPELRN